jgi:hypothetical protein
MSAWGNGSDRPRPATAVILARAVRMDDAENISATTVYPMPT